MQSSVCFGLVFLLHLLSCDFYQVFLNSCIGLGFIWLIVKNWTQLLNHNAGKERIDYSLGLGLSLAEFGSLMGKSQPVLKSISTIAWFLWNWITKFSTQDPGHLVICLLVFPSICLFNPWHSWQISGFSVSPFGKLSGCHCSVCF